jgi:hypothetical protein
MARLSQFDSARIVAGGKVRVTGPAGGTGIKPEHQAGTPVHFAIVRDGNVLRGTGVWGDGKNWSGVTDDKVPGLTPGEAFAFALEVRFWQDKSSGGYQTYAWSQPIQLTKA